MAELVDAHVSGACIERCAGSSPVPGTKESAGSSPVPGTKEILQVTQYERKSKIFFLLYPNLGHSLAIFSRNPLASSPRTRNRTHTKPLGHFDYYAAIGMAVSESSKTPFENARFSICISANSIGVSFSMRSLQTSLIDSKTNFKSEASTMG